jgi:hypothetical protein
MCRDEQLIRFGRLPVDRLAETFHDHVNCGSIDDEPRLAGPDQEAQHEKLQHFADELTVGNVRIYGQKPPSSRLRAVPKAELDQLYAEVASNELRDVTGKQTHYVGVSVNRWDLGRYLRDLRRAGRQTAAVS